MMQEKIQDNKSDDKSSLVAHEGSTFADQVSGSKPQIKNESDNVVSSLLKNAIISKDQLQVAMSEVKMSGGSRKLLDVLTEMGFVSKDTILEITNPSAKRIKLSGKILGQDLVNVIPYKFAISGKLVVIENKDNIVSVAMSNPSNIILIDKIKKYLPGKSIEVLQADESEIISTIEKYYQYSMKVADIILALEKEMDGLNDKKEEADDYTNPIVRLLDCLLIEAINSGASDIHIEPDLMFIKVRYRIDGNMSNKYTFHKKFWARLIGRLKIASNLNIAESRKPQDGATSLTINGKKIDFRVSILPTVHGENAVLRVLDCSKSIVALDKLGFTPHNYKMMQLAMNKPEGIIIVTGPTGSGKTTTLYSVINEINDPSINVMTLEDPVEYSLPIIRQTQINNKAGLDFSAGLRSILRQDPDVVLVGEIRDQETGDIAIKAALTGHQVLSTLHTNDAISAITRLVDIGIKPYLVSSALIAVIAQRLVRRLCKDCKVSCFSSEKETALFNYVTKQNIASYSIFKPSEDGCETCGHTGYKGRVATVEVFFVNKTIGNEISRSASYAELFQIGRQNGFVPMQEDGLLKVISGDTSLEELRDNVDMTEYIKDW